jgi:serine/threonine protein kinase/Tfp pilus assembly protein PilF
VSVLGGDRWRVVSGHLDRALELAGDERKTWLASLQSDDPTLAADVLALLEEHKALDREGFLENVATLPAQTSLAGQRFGAYTLTSLIGQGGMGSVWLARRSDGRFEGQAAVKLLNASLVGRAGETRFRREGSILARLTHPHIAHLLDAGVSPAGQPYLVLEHVEGEPIDRYCDGQRLNVEARLRLFLDVLAAVAHAHANLIVHRDLKPSNVLVRVDNRVMLLDFGIAKLLEGEAGSGEATALTREEGRALTPEYAAPEQVTGGAVTTATDVYALGTLLYVLLSGRHPAEAALHSPVDLLKAIVDAEPKRLSIAVAETRAKTPDEQSSKAAMRSTTPDGLRRLLRGDLDTIVAKALKKNPEERYRSVAALAEDLKRYLGHEPIRARPDKLVYRATKFVRRNRTGVALVALAFVALAAGLAGTISQARRAKGQAAFAEEQRKRADREARIANEQRDFALRQLSRAEAINDLDAYLLSDAAPSGKPFTVGELLERAERTVDRQHADTDENRVEMLAAIGSLYGSRDEDGKARELLGKAFELSRKVSDRSVRAKTACALAGEIAVAGEFPRAEALIRGALDELGEAPQFALHRVNCLLRGSYVAREGGDAPAAIERAQAAQRLLKESRQGSALTELRVSMNLAEAYRMAGWNRQAAAAFEEAFARLSALGREDTERAGTLLNNWGLAVQLLGQPREAERLFRRAIAISSADPTERGVSPMLLNNLARTLLELYRLSEATDYAERAYAKARQAGDEIVVNQALSVRFQIAIERGDFARAADILAELEPRWKRMMPPGHIGFAGLALYEALLALGRGDGQAAVAKADRGIALAEASSQGLDYLPSFLLRRADVNLKVQRYEEARADAERALAMEQKAAVPGAFSSSIGRAYLMLGRALRAQGKHDPAQAALASALEHLQPSLGPDHPKTRIARQLAAFETRP